MMRTGRITISALLLAAGQLAYAQLDGWTKGKGNMDLALSVSFDQGLGYYAGEENIDLKRGRMAISLFAVRGITNNFDVALSIPYADNSGGAGSLQDASLWLKYLPLNTTLGSKWRISGAIALGGSVPMTNYETETLGAIGQQNTAIIPMGLVQFQHNNSGVFFNFSSGYQFKSSPTPDLVPFNIKVGLAKAKYYWEMYLDMGDSQGGKDYRGQGDLQPTTFKEIGTNWITLGAKFYKPVKERMGYAIGVNKVIAGRNYDDSIGASVAYIYKFLAKKRE